MGETNAQLTRRRSLRRDTALAAAAVYGALFGGDGPPGPADPSAPSGNQAAGVRRAGVPATFQVIYMTGWAPHASQQRPKERGSASVSFHDVARGLMEQPAPGGGGAPPGAGAALPAAAGGCCGAARR